MGPMEVLRGVFGGTISVVVVCVDCLIFCSFVAADEAPAFSLWGSPPPESAEAVKDFAIARKLREALQTRFGFQAKATSETILKFL